MAAGHGGRRPGAGRKRKLPVLNDYPDPLEFLRAVGSGQITPTASQLRAAIAALPFLHKKLGDAGLKDQRQAAAVRASGRFAAVAPPRLVQ